jgi:hypothetical protein
MRYGFELNNGREIQVEASSLRAAMDLVETSEGSRVMRGRCLEGYDPSVGMVVPDRELVAAIRAMKTRSETAVGS